MLISIITQPNARIATIDAASIPIAEQSFPRWSGCRQTSRIVQRLRSVGRQAIAIEW
jgi:hypothetical protein